MSNYDFKSLSSWDFEQLVKDLLQAELRLLLESFTTGRDHGIDLRYATVKGDNLIVQCKHYTASGVSKLLSDLRTKESPKVKRLKPTRYILATSVGLTPGNKDEIKRIFHPYCKSTADIFGQTEINGLLRRHSKIETQHYKLWLTSYAVLEKALNSSIFNQTQFERERIERRFQYYVQNQSFFDAKEILEKLHYCIVAGIPGIGKTTLAEMLLVEYLCSGYEPIKIVSDIREATKVYKAGEKQIFYYDDFLGQTSLEEKLNKNEESNLLRFIDAVSRSPTARFLLTTREYILNQAKLTYEQLSRSTFDQRKCVIDLASYTKSDRAKILYNHLYFSGIASEYRAALLNHRVYHRIINHRNFNPRVIEWMTDHLQIQNIPPEEYISEFIKRLEDPSLIWDHAFRRQISSAGNTLLIVMVTLPYEVFIDDLEAAFNASHTLRAKKFGFSIGPADFRDALQELDGNFITSEKYKAGICVRFHNPSIRDYLETYIQSNQEELLIAIRAVVFFVQCRILWTKNFNSLPELREISSAHRAEMINSIQRSFGSEECQLITVLRGANATEDRSRWSKSLARRTKFAIDVANDLTQSESQQVVEVLVERLFGEMKNGSNEDKEPLVSLHESLRDVSWGNELNARYLEFTKEYLRSSLEQIEDFKILGNFNDEFPNILHPSELLEIRGQLKELAGDEVGWIRTSYDEDLLLDYIDNLTRASESLQMDLSNEISRLQERIDELKIHDEIETSENTKRNAPQEHINDDEVDSLFDLLRD